MDRFALHFEIYKMKKLLIAVSLLASSTVFASEQDKLAKYNTDVSKSIRQSHADKLAQTTYREINVKDARVSDDVSKVYPQIETKVTKDGSATRVVAEAVLNTDKEKVAKDWAKKLNHAAKFGTGVLGGAAVGLMVDQLLEAIDYVMGEGGQVLKKPNLTDPDSPNVQYYYTIQLQGGVTFPSGVNTSSKFISAEAACRAVNGGTAGGNKITYAHTTLKINGYDSTCYGTWYGWSTPQTYASAIRRNNPNYDSSSSSEPQPATENDIKDAIKTKVLDKASTDPTARNLAKNLVKESYARIWDDKGNSLEIRGDVTNKQKDILNSNDPTSDGHTTSTPTITDGKSGSGSSSSGSSSSGTSEGTTFNPDGSVASSSVTTTTTTSTSTTNIEFELPAFCDWASTVCEWLGWTQEPLEQDTELDIPDPELPEIDTDISFSGECPADRTVYFPMPLGKNLEFTLSYQLLCEPLEQAKPVLIAVGLFLSALIVGGLRQ